MAVCKKQCFGLYQLLKETPHYVHQLGTNLEQEHGSCKYTNTDVMQMLNGIQDRFHVLLRSVFGFTFAPKQPQLIRYRKLYIAKRASPYASAYSWNFSHHRFYFMSFHFLFLTSLLQVYKDTFLNMALISFTPIALISSILPPRGLMFVPAIGGRNNIHSYVSISV